MGFFIGFIALIGAYVLTIALKRALVDPIVTIAMIRAYQMSIQGLEPAMDLQQNLLGVSSKFKDLFQKANEEQVRPTQPIESVT